MDDVNNVKLPSRPRREYVIKDPYYFDNYFGNTVLVVTANTNPLIYKQALKLPNAFRQIKAIDKEINSYYSNNTFEIVEIPKDRKLISSKWVFKKKYLPTGLIDKYKARLVARGFTQKYGIDYEETFLLILRYESLRVTVRGEWVEW